jgi:hypothetical protein
MFSEETGMDEPSLSAHIQRQLDALEAKTAFFAKHLVSSKSIAIRADDPLNTLSVIKIAIMVPAYRDAEKGTLDLDQRYQIRDDDFRRGSGVLQTFAPGLQPTYRDLITQMIITSDNTATDILIARLGLARVNTMLAALGYTTTRLQRSRTFWYNCSLRRMAGVRGRDAGRQFGRAEPVERVGKQWLADEGWPLSCAIEVKLTVLDAPKLTMPRAWTPEGWLTFGLHENVNEAISIAIDQMLHLMDELLGQPRKTALGLASLFVDVRITQLVNGVVGAHAVLPHTRTGLS